MIRETATLNNQGQQVTNYDAIGYESRKRVYLTELFKTGCLNGNFFNKVFTKNPVRQYIAGCMYKLRMPLDSDLIDDCYNEMFVHLQLIDAKKVCELYDESPNKLIGYGLKIVSLKCFAIDPRYGNPRHSLIQSVMFASAINSVYIDPCDVVHEVENYQHKTSIKFNNKTNLTNLIPSLRTIDDDPCDFERKYGFTPEQLLDKLEPNDIVTFYDMIGKQSRGKVSQSKQVERDRVIAKIQELARVNPDKRTYQLRTERQFKDSIYEPLT